MDLQTNELMLLLLRNSAAAFGIKDLDGNYLLVNQGLRRIAGIDARSAAEIHDHDLLPPLAAAKLADATRKLVGEVRTFVETLELMADDRLTEYMTIGFPIKGDSDELVAIGLLLVESPKPRNLDDPVSQALAQSQRLNTELQGVLQEMELRASTDRLTNAWNRRWLEETLLNEMSRFERYGHPISILLLDLDHFKAVNDEHGHTVGDAVLREFADRIRAADRDSDSLVRWGGEEFIVLCPNTPLHAAALLAERVRRCTVATPFATAGAVSCSIGVAEYQAGETWTQWFARADAALYRAKAGGRNRLDMAPESHFDQQDHPREQDTLVQLVWRRAYECGHELIDAQHRELFAIANELLAAVLEDQTAAEIIRKAKLMQDKLIEHFRHEEAIIDAAGFPESEAHAQTHAELLARVDALIESFHRDEANIGDLFGFLAYDVVTKHLLRTDRLFFEHLAVQV